MRSPLALVLVAACTSSTPPPASPAPRADADIARLRAGGPAALAPLLTAYDAAGPAERPALATTIDRVAAQRYATVSRLYWYTDLPAAQAAARASGRPILSLRMLGRLDEDLSCANSRFFRTLLYANAEVSAYLRDHFVLHWSTERPVPRVTIDFGDGRRLERTVTGNSAHYVLDADGRPVDVLPGLYTPAVFQAELARAHALAASLAGLDGAARADALRVAHDQRLRARAGDWQALGRVPVRRSGKDMLADAQRAAITKARVEIPDLRMVELGPDPRQLDGDAAVWASIGQRLFGDAPLLDAQSRALVLALAAAPADPSVPPLAEAEMLAALEQAVIADTAQNELRLRAQIHAQLIARPHMDFTELNRWIYDSVFHTPAGDAWLGLLSRTTFTGLAGDGIVMAPSPTKFAGAVARAQ